MPPSQEVLLQLRSSAADHCMVRENPDNKFRYLPRYIQAGILTSLLYLRKTNDSIENEQ